MAYQENTALSPDDAIDKIVNFASANGWTVHRNTLAGTARTATVSKGTDYIHLWNPNDSEIRITASIEYDGALAPESQAKRGSTAATNLGVGPYTRLYMFADSTPSGHIHVVIETNNSIFKHLSFGMLDRIGITGWTGGTYYDASWWATGGTQSYMWSSACHALFETPSSTSAIYRGSVRCDIPADSKVDAWALFYGYSGNFHVQSGLSGRYSSGNNADGEGYLTTQFYNRNNAPFSGQVALGAIRIDVMRPSSLYSTIGTIPNVRYLTMERYAPGQEITIGSEIWKVFPMLRQGAGVYNVSYPYSNNHAYAYKKVV